MIINAKYKRDTKHKSKRKILKKRKTCQIIMRID
jgi:hypothetical protein